MIIKKFTAKTEADAIEAAKKELGENLVIMNVKSIKKKGFLGLFKSTLTEVTVALEEEKSRIELCRYLVQRKKRMVHWFRILFGRKKSMK